MRYFCVLFEIYCDLMLIFYLFKILQNTHIIPIFGVLHVSTVSTSIFCFSGFIIIFHFPIVGYLTWHGVAVGMFLSTVPFWLFCLQIIYLPVYYFCFKGLLPLLKLFGSKPSSGFLLSFNSWPTKRSLSFRHLLRNSTT